MPVRLLNSSILKWADAKTVDETFRCLAQKLVQNRQDILKIGYFGSYARGDWGVGSDLDIIIIVENSQLPFNIRSIEFDWTELPVPSDVLVYTEKEWSNQSKTRFYKVIIKEAVWVYQR